MANYKLSKEFLNGIEALITLDENSFQNMIRVISELKAGTGPKNFRKQVEESLPGSKIDYLSSALYSLGDFYASEKKTLEDTVNELNQSYWLGKESTQRETDELLLVNRLKLILEHYASFKTTFKAISLLTENDRLFRESRIITDVRLMFSEQLEESISNAVIVHQLKLSTLSNGKKEELYLSLDDSDLETLKETLDRAIKKGEKIRSDFHDRLNFITITD